jgi:hypothetical protein
MGVNYTVNFTSDLGTGSGTTGSLRYCMNTANAIAGSHTINFSGLAACNFFLIQLDGKVLNIIGTLTLLKQQI